MDPKFYYDLPHYEAYSYSIELWSEGHCDCIGFIQAQEAQLVTVCVQEPLLDILLIERN